ncbi:MAG: orotidine-5'-phosphate decarboxylase [Candidatus Altiarchaeales archaeon]|nr:orotidine-5'-phosphate decarboxylase [Candidatus Altiarchaeota archaeon]MCG2783242.1 orotidine-5'-phosphate decarboxylase [Candidatus Altiarchaeales archaeon]MBU4265810.1 orotidine-5'-phosphate decarboxylase [Candidatus Altiarchaeota archaeon]MBU4342110.1 orotidine-5'-phosphate decarboxylase [Candidatus Altiarchaeota archaeon]MBU4406998.1 orotidine-5'-phosphate decarboxylase [Candidatus Altiarchaeota archaeon]
MSEFLQKYLKAREEKNSTLCIGLDPAMPGLRKENIMPDDDIMGFCLDIIDKTAPHACAFKANSQYILFNLNMEQLQELNQKIHGSGSISILDHKLSDIGSSNLAAIHSAKKAGFDAITFSPFAGNIKEAVNQCHSNGLGIFVLTLMSNPEARIQKEFSRSGENLYEWIAAEAKDADGLVVGLTENATSKEIQKIREIAGKDKILLCPGLGAQGGSTDKLPAGNSLVNVGRDIIYSKDPVKKASEFSQQLKLR